MSKHYNFVYFFNNLGEDQTFLDGTTREIGDNVMIMPGASARFAPALKLLHRIHFSGKINRYISLPFKRIWNRSYFKNTFSSDAPVCFLFDRFLDQVFSQTDYYSYLRKVYPKCKLIFVFRDRVEGTTQPYDAEKRDQLRRIFDDVLVYSLFDAVDFGFTYFPSFESKVPMQSEPKFEDVDLFYAGAAKDRLKLLQDICRRANQEGLKCYFYVYRAKEEEKIPLDGMIYSDNWMPFDELLRRACSAKCMVDILQGQAAGFTSRFWHAVFYNKQLISNNPLIRFTRYYNGKHMQLIQTAEDIDVAALKDTQEIDYQYQDEFSASNFIDFLDARLTTHVSPEEYYSDWFDIKGYKKFLGI